MLLIDDESQNIRRIGEQISGKKRKTQFDMKKILNFLQHIFTTKF